MARLKIKLIFGLLLITFISYIPSFDNQFTNWDDQVHLLDNVHVRYLNWEHVTHTFQESINRTYIPLTILSFALEYHFFGLQPWIYHLDNFLLHLAVVLLIFQFCIQLGLAPWASFFASLLFAVHPMHVESVAWVTERKDVLYSFFYMAALNCYLVYLKHRKIAFFVLSYILGCLSFLSKGMAYSLPLVLFLCDWIMQRKIRWKSLARLSLFAGNSRVKFS